MITREELRSIPSLYKQIRKDREQLLFLQDKATSIPSTLSEHERVQASHTRNANIYIEEAVDLNREIELQERQLLDLQEEAAKLIDTITAERSLQRKIMRYRYLECMEWQEIGELLGYVEGYLRRVENKILCEIYK